MSRRGIRPTVARPSMLARRTQAAPPELHAAAAQWGEAATQMLLAMAERLDALEKRVTDLETERDALTRRGTP